MLPWVYDPDAEAGSQNIKQESVVGEHYERPRERFYNDYYQNFEETADSSRYYQSEPRRGEHPNLRDRRRADSPSRFRKRSRSRSRDRRYSRGRSRSHSRSPVRRRRSRSRSREREPYAAVPVNKLALLNMPSNVDRNAIALVLASSGYLPQDIRVINRRGGSRSFGFIDFADVKTAIKWMDENQGWLTLSDGRRVQVEYAKSDPASCGRRTDHDWTCANCSVQNFFKRDACFKCDTEKGASMKLERQGLHMVGVVPCDTLLLRALPEGCTTATLFEGLSQYTALTSIVQLQISDSKQYAYIQMKSSDEATLLLNSSYKAPIKIGGRDVVMTFCRHSMSHLIRQQINMLQNRNMIPQQNAVGLNPNAHGAEVAQAAMAALRQSQGHTMPPNVAVPPQHMILMQQQQQQGQPQSLITSTQHGFNLPVAQQSGTTSVQQPSYAVVATTPVNGIIGMTPTPRGVFSKYVVPNPATFCFDQTSGYYVDPETKFFYDQKTGYYFNNDIRKWCTWDATYSTYFPIEDNADATTAAANTNTNSAEATQSSEEKKPADKQEEQKKSANDIAKEMLKWAKKQEKASKVQLSLKPLVKPLETKSAFETAQVAGGAGANVAHKMLEKSQNPLAHVNDSDEEDGSGDEKKRISTEDATVPPRRHLPTAQEHREMMERSLVDEGKKMCLLCKRAFPSVDVLRKHVEKSDLHKKNLEEKSVEWGRQYVKAMMEDDADAQQALTHAIEPPVEQKVVYRDRAKERRQAFGLDPGVSEYPREDFGSRSEEALRKESEAASMRPLGDDNIGSRLLKGMGWREGQGVGRNGQGIINPIETQRRIEGAGLGSAGSRVLHCAEASHQERVRATFFSRYKDMN
ncbi:g-patch domain protein [Dictyocaulus viviparus]|uniref:G-patch domain protein n=1 Tax=Dictyocaulus viviparus TaxID=29172 RepID=A0A0D8XDS4_DICVI|nr:g-patch domain protein [Dictyocaulus viviparus]